MTYSVPGNAYSTGCISNSCPPDLTLTYSITVTGGYATHDLSVLPNFVDSTRNVSTWDSSLGGPGTEAHAFAQLLLSYDSSPTVSSFTIDNLLAYVRAGFVPQNAALHNAGMGGVDIGAIAVASGGGGTGNKIYICPLQLTVPPTGTVVATVGACQLQ